MAQRINIVLTDDIDESVAQETVTFGLDGVNYEIDLSEEHAAQLRDALMPFITAGRRTGGAKVGRGRRAAKAAAAGASDATEIRAWAQEQGMTVSSRGRVPAEIRAAYEAAH